MPRTPEQTIEDLRRIGAPKVLVRLANGEPAPGCIRWQFQQPKEFYALVTEFPGNMPFEDQLIPLWETNGDSITAYVDRAAPTVIRYFYEDPDDKLQTVGSSVIEAIEHRLEWLLAECGADPGDVLAAAEACDHPNPTEFVARVQREN